MVDMNTDHISDTPDRIQQSVCPVSSSAATRGVTRMAANPSPARRIKFKIKNISTQGQSSRGDAVSELPAALDTDNIFNQAELARKLSPPKLDRTTGKSVVNGNGAHSHDLDQSSSISNHMVSRGDGVRGSSCQIREGQVGHRDASRRHADFLGVGSDLPTGTIIIDLTDKSPTITKSGASVNYMETTASEKFRTARAGGTLIPQGANQASSGNCSEGLNNKAKEIIHPVMGTEQAGEADTMRVCPRALVGSFVNDDSTDISQQGWRTTHNHTIKLPMSLLCKTTSTSGMESGSSGPSNQGQETAEEDNNNSCRAATAMRSASLRNRAIRSSKRKRKHTSSSYQPGESSSSVNELGSSCLASSDTTAGRNHTTRCHNISVIDIDDISPPEARSSLSGRSNGTSIDPNVSAQLEAYELLAWQLQEQLYNETPRIAPREEIDAIVRGSSCQIREGQVGHRDAGRRHVDFLGVGSDLPTGTIIIDLTDKSPTITKNGASVNYMETTASEKFRTARAGGTLIRQGANQASSSNCSEGLNNKAKEIIHPFMGTEQAGEADTMRVCPRAPVGSFVNDDSTGISQQVWRTTHNHTIKLPMSLLCKTTSTSGMESGSSGPSNQGQETAEEDNNNSCRAATAMRSASLRNRAIRSSKRKRKHKSSSYQPGESSSSVNELGSSCLASSDTTAGRNHTTRCHNISVIDIDDISPPEARPSLSGRSNGTSIDPNVSAQLEADELLARQLQEQLYNETPRIAPREEIDAIVAMSVQHVEDAEWTSRTVRAPARWISNDTRAFRGGYRAARIQPIDLNDYDALLAIDENNNQHTGASESQINNLPLSVFQSTSTEEPCMVCLENPSVGDTIRTLPCFHKFHKECIDEWLRRKKQCPVCMCGITSSWPMQF